jgi:flagellar motor switch protein FliM
MAKILSQEEVDALLSEFSDEEAAGTAAGAAKKIAVKPKKKKETADKDKKVSAYNFRRPDRVSKEQMRFLHSLHQRFARIFSSSLSAYLRALIEVNLYLIEPLTYGEFILSLPDPTYLNAIAMEPLEENWILEINPKIHFPMIDKMLGGKGEDFGGVRRTLTDIERTLIEGVVQLVLRDLEESWKQIAKLRMSIAATETSPQLLQAAAPNEIVLLIVFELKIGEAKGFMNLGIPSMVLEPIVERFSQDWHTHRTKTSIEELKKIKLNLLKTKIRAEAGIYENRLSVKDLLTLAPGNVLKLESKIDDEINVKLNGIKKFSVYQVKKGRKKAVQIVDLIPREFKNE